MKKHLLLLVVSIAMIQLVSAQVIDIVGNGVLDQETPTLTITDLSSVDKVVVEAAARFLHGAVAPTKVPDEITFSSMVSFTVPFTPVEEIKAPGAILSTYGSYSYNGNYYSDGYYTATFESAEINPSGVISLDKNGQGNSIMTYFAYVYRTDGNVNKYSIISAPENRAFVFLNGAEDPLVRNFVMPASTGPRNIEVAVPLSDGDDDDDRVGVITLFSGDQQTDAQVFQLNNGWVNFHVERIMLYDVPMNVTDVKIELYSPQSPIEGKNGDSFTVGLPVLTVENIIDPGCTLTQGYWKTHSTYGPATKPDNTWDEVGGPDANFYLSNQTWIEVFNTSVSGNSYYQLAHQYMAAYLNALHGAMVPTGVQDALDDASSIFGNKTPAYFAKVKGKTLATKAEVSQMVSLASILGSYNEGIIGPGHCGESDDIMEKSAKISIDNEIVGEFSVYPNPVSNNAIVSFKPVNDGLATVELYNSVGQKVGRLLQQNVLKGIQVKAAFSGLELNEGLYIVILQNGNYRETAKIRISR